MTYRCPKGCFSNDPNFKCAHGGATGKSIEPMLGPHGGGRSYLEIADTPGDLVQRQAVADYRARLAMEKRWRAEEAEQRLVLEAQAERAIRLSDALACCPCPGIVAW